MPELLRVLGANILWMEGSIAAPEYEDSLLDLTTQLAMLQRDCRDLLRKIYNVKQAANQAKPTEVRVLDQLANELRRKGITLDMLREGLAKMKSSQGGQGGPSGK